MAQRVDGESPSPAISVGDGEVLRLAVTLAAARGLLSVSYTHLTLPTKA